MYRIEGSGEHIVLIHGLPTDCSEVGDVIALVGDGGARIDIGAEPEQDGKVRTKRNFASFLALVAGFILVKSVHTT